MILFPMKQQQYWYCKKRSSLLSELLQILITGSCYSLFNSSAPQNSIFLSPSAFGSLEFSSLNISAQMWKLLLMP